MNTRTILVAICSVLISAATATAGERKADFGLDVETGYYHDSNVGIVDIDSISGSADSAVKIGAGVDASLPFGQHATLRLGYDYDSTSYQTLDTFDLGLHHAMAELGFNRFGFDSALTADRFVASLDGDEYLTLTQLSPSVSKLFGNRVYARLAYTSATKDYATLTTRNADSESLRADVYWLLDGMNRYVAVGLQSSAEDALDDELDYDGLRTMLTLGQTLDVSSMTLKLKGELRYESRDYLNVTGSIGEARRDERLRAAVIAAVPLGEHFEVRAEVEHTQNESNLDSATLDRMAYGLTLSASF